MEFLRLQQIREALAKDAHVAGEVDGGVTYNGQEGRMVKRAYVFVSPGQPTEISFDDFSAGLLSDEKYQVPSWSRYRGELYTSESDGAYSEVLAKQMYPDAAHAIAELEVLRERLQK